MADFKYTPKWTVFENDTSGILTKPLLYAPVLGKRKRSLGKLFTKLIFYYIFFIIFDA